MEQSSDDLRAQTYPLLKKALPCMDASQTPIDYCVLILPQSEYKPLDRYVADRNREAAEACLSQGFFDEVDVAAVKRILSSQKICANKQDVPLYCLLRSSQTKVR
jgi:hypothetical protein